MGELRDEPHPMTKQLPRPKLVLLRFDDVFTRDQALKIQFFEFTRKDFPYFVKRNFYQYQKWFTKMIEENHLYTANSGRCDVSAVVTTNEGCIADSLGIWAQFCLTEFDIFAPSFGKEFPVAQKIFLESVFLGMLEGSLKLAIQESIVRFLQITRKRGVPVFVLSQLTAYMYEKETILKYTEYGDITPFISGFIDPVKENLDLNKKETYVEIAQKNGFLAEDIMFITGSAKEAKKAARAGLFVVNTNRADVNKKYNNITLVENLGNIEFFN